MLGTTGFYSSSGSCSTASNRPTAAGSSSICRMVLYGAIPVWLANEAPTTISRSASFISQLATGVPLRPSTPAPSGAGGGGSGRRDRAAAPPPAPGTPRVGRGPGRAPRPGTADGPWRETATTGDWSSLASYRPVSMLVDPGPAIAKQTAGLPVSLPYALAAKEAAPSCRIPI